MSAWASREALALSSARRRRRCLDSRANRGSFPITIRKCAKAHPNFMRSAACATTSARGATSRDRPLFLLHGWMDVSASFQFLVDCLQRDVARHRARLARLRIDRVGARRLLVSGLLRGPRRADRHLFAGHAGGYRRTQHGRQYRRHVCGLAPRTRAARDHAGRARARAHDCGCRAEAPRAVDGRPARSAAAVQTLCLIHRTGGAAEAQQSAPHAGKSRVPRAALGPEDGRRETSSCAAIRATRSRTPIPSASKNRSRSGAARPPRCCS